MIHHSPISISIFIVETENPEIITLIELKGRAHEAALKAIAKSKTPSHYAFKKNNEFLIGHEFNRPNKKFFLFDKGLKIELSDRVREINENEFEEIRRSAANYFRSPTEEKKSEKKEVLKEAHVHKESLKNDKETPKRRLSAKDYFEERIKKETAEIERKSQHDKAERIKRFEKRMAEKEKRIEAFKKGRSI